MLYATVLVVSLSQYGQLTVAEEKFAAEVIKADAEAAKVKHAAAEVRLKAYREALQSATKAGDFDKAMALKARIEELEQEPTAQPLKRPRPKDIVRFQGHSYALVKDAVTWHVAKQRCEEMGGHLICINNPKEASFVVELSSGNAVWLGASNEFDLGKWEWIDGRIADVNGWTLNDPDRMHFSKAAIYWPETKTINDHDFGAHSAYVCEWSR